MLRPIAVCVVLASLVPLSGCCCGCTFPAAPGGPAAVGPVAEDNGPKEEKKKEPAVAVTAADLLDDYEANEVDADSRYKRRVVQVTGTVNRVATDVFGKPFITLVNSRKKLSIFQVQCLFKSRDAVIDVRPNDTIVISGTCTGKMGNVVLRDCIIDKHEFLK